MRPKVRRRLDSTATCSRTPSEKNNRERFLTALTHSFRDHADAVDARALRGVDDLRNLAVTHPAITHHVERLVTPPAEDLAEGRLRGRDLDGTFIDCQLVICRVLGDDAAGIRRGIRR